MANSVDARLTELGIVLPAAAAPVANYVAHLTTGNLVFVSGQLPMWEGKLQLPGRLGDNLDIAQGQQAAKYCALNLLAQLKAATGGNLDRVATVVKLTGYVNCTAEFTDQAQVINGASDMMVEVLGERGKHTRAATGCMSLPLGAAVEVDGVFELA